MKKLLILGAVTAGTKMANKLRKTFSRDEWDITIVDQFKTHYYPNIFVIGHAANISTSKAGSVAHSAAEIIKENLLCAIEGRELCS